MMQKGKLSRREREKLRQRHDILAGALTLFSQKGYHNVSMHEIAGKSEFAIGTLYKFFKNKEDLYKSLLLKDLTGFMKSLQRPLKKDMMRSKNCRLISSPRGGFSEIIFPWSDFILPRRGEIALTSWPDWIPRFVKNKRLLYKNLPWFLKAASKRTGSRRYQILIIWQFPLRASPMHFFFSGLKRLNGIPIQMIQIKFWIFF